MVHRASELNVTEVSGTVYHVALACEAFRVLTHSSHARIVDCIKIRQKCNFIVYAFAVNIGNRDLCNIFRVQYSEFYSSGLSVLNI